MRPAFGVRPGRCERHAQPWVPYSHSLARRTQPPADAPNALFTANSSAVRFTASEEGCDYHCALVRAEPGGGAPPAPTDPSAFKPCASPERLGELTDGAYTLAGAQA